MKSRTYRSHRFGDDPAGYTLIEILVVVSFIAILASIAIQRFPTVRELTLAAEVKSDLQNAMKAEEAFFVDSGRYEPFSVTDGGSIAIPEFSASSGVSVTAILVGEGVRLVGSHKGSSTPYCLSTTSGKIVEGTGC